MKYIKLFEELDIEKRKQKIYVLCEDLGLSNYTVNDDLTVDVDDHVIIKDRKFKKLPVMFGTIGGDFIIKSCNNLQTLVGSPKIVYCNYELVGNFSLKDMDYVPYLVGGSFKIKYHKNLLNIKYPNKIGGDIILSNLYIEALGDMNKCDCGASDIELYHLFELNSLKGLPSVIEDSLNIETCFKLNNLDGFPDKVGNSIKICNNPITSLKGLPKEVYDIRLDNNRELRSLEFIPNVINGSFILYNTYLETFKYFPTIVKMACVIHLNMNRDIKFPEKIIKHINNLNDEKIIEFINLMNEYGVWNSDGSFNSKRYELVEDELY